MKRSMVACCALMLVLLSAPAYAADSWFAPYLELKLGAGYTQANSMKNDSLTNFPATINKTSGEDTVGVLGFAAGLNFKNLGVPVRAELEYATRSAYAYNSNPTFTNAGWPTSLKSNLYSQTLFLNVYYDIATGTAFTPYVGAGIGMALNHTRTQLTDLLGGGVLSTYGTEKTTMAWNVGLGCAYDITENWKLDAGYRYIDLGSARWGDAGNTVQVGLKSEDVTIHEVLLGLRYQF